MARRVPELGGRAKRLGVWANADAPEDALKARDLGATGIGLCRTEHMFMEPSRLPLIQRMILETRSRRAPRGAASGSHSSGKLKGILAAMAGYPVTIRLLDPPLHEFLPSLEDLLVETTELKFTESVDIVWIRERMRS